MRKFENAIKIGTFVWLESGETDTVTEFNANRIHVKLRLHEGSFQRAHIVRFSNKPQKPKRD